MTNDFEHTLLQHLEATLRRHCAGLTQHTTISRPGRQLLAADMNLAARAMLRLGAELHAPVGSRALLMRCRTCERWLLSPNALAPNALPHIATTFDESANAIDYLITQPRFDVSRN
jgi:hypothetical protein